MTIHVSVKDICACKTAANVCDCLFVCHKMFICLLYTSYRSNWNYASTQCLLTLSVLDSNSKRSLCDNLSISD